MRRLHLAFCIVVVGMLCSVGVAYDYLGYYYYTIGQHGSLATGYDNYYGITYSEGVGDPNLDGTYESYTYYYQGHVNGEASSQVQMANWQSMIGYDSSGNPYYWQAVQTTEGYYAYYLAWYDYTLGWVEQTVIASLPATDKTKAVQGEDGNFYAISYNGSGITYYSKTGDTWGSSTVCQTTGDQRITSADLAVNSSGNAYVAYNDYFSYDYGYGLNCANNASGNWTHQVVNRRTDYGDAGANPSVAIMPNGMPGIASTYKDFDDAGGSLISSYLQYSRYFTDRGWQNWYASMSSDNYSGGDGNQYTGFNPKLAYDAAGNAHMVYSDAAVYHQPFQLQDGTWTTAQYQQVGQVRHLYYTGVAWYHYLLYSQTPTAQDGNPQDQMTITDFAPATTGGRVYVGGYEQTPGATPTDPWKSSYRYFAADNAGPPSATTATSPTGTVGSTVRPEFNWDHEYGATWYRLWINRNGSSYRSKWVNGTSWTADADFPSGDYSYWVQTWNPHGHGQWSGEYQFNIPRYNPGTCTPHSPSGTVSNTRTPEFNWSSADRADWYQLYVARQGEGTYATKWVQAPNTSYTFNMDLKGGDYRWWVAGYNGDGYGDWSAPTDFSIPFDPPGKISTLSPSGGVSVASGDVQFEWNSDANATWYQLWCGTPGWSGSQWYEGSFIVSGGVARATMALQRWGDYHWYARGWGVDGFGEWSAGSDISCGRPVGVDANATTLKWNDTFSTSAEWYQVWINDVSGGGRVKERAVWLRRAEAHDVGVGNLAATLDPPLSTGDYEWSVRAYNSVNGMSQWSKAQTFTVP